MTPDIRTQPQGTYLRDLIVRVEAADRQRAEVIARDWLGGPHRTDGYEIVSATRDQQPGTRKGVWEFTFRHKETQT